jgi:hypothetical protein
VVHSRLMSAVRSVGTGLHSPKTSSNYMGKTSKALLSLLGERALEAGPANPWLRARLAVPGYSLANSNPSSRRIRSTVFLNSATLAVYLTSQDTTSEFTFSAGSMRNPGFPTSVPGTAPLISRYAASSALPRL